MREVSFPLIEDLLEEKRGTLCALSDPPGRLRDGMAVTALTQFCAARGVHLQIQQILASHRRYVDAEALLLGLTPDDHETIERLLKSDSPLQDKICSLFDMTERLRLERGEAEEAVALEPRGPVIVIGRPQLYSRSFQNAIQAELPDELGLIGRFEMANPVAQSDKFWEVHDHYFNLTIPNPSGPRDLAVLRKIRGRYSRRTFLFVYGTSSLGTMAATQLLIDEDLNEDLSRANVSAALQKHGSTELLIQVDIGAHHQGDDSADTSGRTRIWTREFEPRQIRLLTEPTPPMSNDVMRWVREFETGAQTEELQSVYRQVTTETDNLIRYEVIGIHPQDDAERLGWFMVGGREIARCVQSLRDLAKAKRRLPILLAGPTGSGKELGARVVFQERILDLLRRLAKREEAWPAPVVIGACFTEINCAKVTQTLAEAEYFGVREKSATDVIGRPGLILEAGEGVAFLDEVSFMNLKEQAGLLRAVQPPYGIRSVGSSQGIPSTAQLIAAMSDDPERLVETGKMLPELWARFRPGIVRFPGLNERRGDIPALLAHLAGGCVRMTGTVLRCLLTGSYPYNVRDLQHIVARAQARRNSTDSVEITIDALEHPPSYRHIAALTGDLSRHANTHFEFAAPPASSVRGAVFDIAARALTAFANDSAGVIRPRWTEESDRLGLRASSYSLTDLDVVASALNEAILLIVQEAAESERNELLHLLAYLLDERYSAWQKDDERLKKKRNLAIHMKGKLRKPPIEYRNLSTIFKASDAWVTGLSSSGRRGKLKD